MPCVTYEDSSFAIQSGETVLDTLLRNGVPASHNCRAGSCGACLMRAVSGTVPPAAQSGLKDSWKANGYFLPCVCKPDADLTVAKVGADAQVSATIAALERLSGDVLRVRLACDAPMSFRAGQYVTLVREETLARSYSIACLPDGQELELHVRRVAGGRMSGWLHDAAQVGERLSVLGPSGECFYVPGREDQPMLLVGTGTGLAPLYGILRDALQCGHRGPIQLFHGALHAGGLYLVEELQRLAAEYPQVTYTPAVLRGDASDGVTVGPIDQVVLQRIPKLNGWRVFVCGDPVLVQSMKKKLFLAGAASRDIYSDAFLPAAAASGAAAGS